MENKRSLSVVLLLLFFLVVTVTASTARLNEELDIKIICLNNGYCSASSHCNLNIAYPNNSWIVDGQNTTNQRNFHNYTILPDVNGWYEMSGLCKDGADSWEINDRFLVTTTGEELTVSKSIIYILILIISILMVLGLLWAGLVLPSGNNRDEMTGYILSISNLKYLKYLFLTFSYVFLVWVSYFIWMISYAYLDFNFLTNIFRFIFTALAYTTLPLFILYVYFTITALIKDQQIAEMLMYGLDVK